MSAVRAHTEPEAVIDIGLKVRNTRTSDGRAGAALIKRILTEAGRGPPPKPRAVADMSDALKPTATLFDLRHGKCHWPIGDPSTEALSFCGRKTRTDSSYCPCHHARAYEPPLVPAQEYIEAVIRFARHHDKRLRETGGRSNPRPRRD